VLHKDVYRRLTEPCALAGLLRVRTSPEFKVTWAFGHLFPDERFENLCHVIACSPSSAFVFDLDFTDMGGFSEEGHSPPMLQMAFQYSVAVPKEVASEDGGPAENGHDANEITHRGPRLGSSMTVLLHNWRSHERVHVSGHFYIRCTRISTQNITCHIDKMSWA
jgi:hypothetical protein